MLVGHVRGVLDEVVDAVRCGDIFQRIRACSRRSESEH